MLFFMLILFGLNFQVESSLQGVICSNHSYYGKVELKQNGKICFAINNVVPVSYTELEDACVNVTDVVCEASMSTTPHTCPCDVNLTIISTSHCCLIANHM